MVFCKMNYCPYWQADGGLCGRSITTIDRNGMCSVLWFNGRQRDLRPPFDENIYKKEPIPVMDIVGEPYIEDIDREEVEDPSE